jgi:opacity protein-like surface antigen
VGVIEGFLEMKKMLLAAAVAAAVLAPAAANASVYKFTFESFDSELTAGGQITVNTDGEVTGVSGVISGLAEQTISAVAPNPNFSGAAYSPDGSFIYDNLYHASGMPFDVDGLLFVTAQNPGGYWNLWGTSPGNYSLWESVGSYNYPIEESGTLSVAAVPELSTWAMMLAGFAGLGFASYRASRRTAAAGLRA